MKLLSLFCLLILPLVKADFLIESNTEIHSGKELLMSYKADNGDAVFIYSSETDFLAGDSNANYSVADNNDFTITGSQSTFEYNLDSLDNKTDGKYHFFETGRNVNVYVVDTGVGAHPDLGKRLKPGYSSFADGIYNDCHGHGTHVASTVAGREYGVAKRANIIPVRVLDCYGSGSASNVAKGINWILTQKKGVVSMSLGGNGNDIIDRAVATLIRNGFVVVVAAGNEETDACTRTPARVGDAITVGCTDSDEEICYFSNIGSCLDLFANGMDILGANFKNGGSIRMSGTSMSTPMVSGVVAQILQRFPKADSTRLREILMSISVDSVVDSPADTTTLGLRTFKRKSGK